MGVADADGSIGRLHHRGIPHFGVKIAGGERGGNREADAGPDAWFLRKHRMPVVFRPEAAGRVDGRAANVGMDINPARHYHQVRRVNHLGGRLARVYDLAVLNTDLFDGAIDPVGRIVDLTPDDLEGAPHRPQPLTRPADAGAPLPPFFIAETFGKIRSRAS